jgi:hypothetical protein
MMKAVLLLLCLSLTACSTMQQFDCPYKDGARCLSVGEIDQRINTGQLGQDLGNKNASSTKKLDVLSNSTIATTSLRTPETVLMAWIAPYYTTDGVYHEGHRIHFVGSEATWSNTHAEINMPGEHP